MLEHQISSAHKPYIEITVSNQTGLHKTFKIHFEITIKLSLEGAVLTSGGGKIREIGSASGKIKGEIKIEGKEFWKNDTKSFALPGTIHLGDGAAIEGEPGDSFQANDDAGVSQRAAPSNAVSEAANAF